jgi:hypothetical protein
MTYGLRVACKNQSIEKKKTYLCQHFKGNDIHVPNNEANNIKVTNKIPILKFGLNKGYFIPSFNDTTFIKGPLIFIIYFISS